MIHRNDLDDYRLYHIGGDGKIARAEWIKAEDDKQAVEIARSMDEYGAKCEVWRGTELIAEIVFHRP